MLLAFSLIANRPWSFVLQVVERAVTFVYISHSSCTRLNPDVMFDHHECLLVEHLSCSAYTVIDTQCSIQALDGEVCSFWRQCFYGFSNGE